MQDVELIYDTYESDQTDADVENYPQNDHPYYETDDYVEENDGQN